MADHHGLLDWRGALRAHRKQRRLSRNELARRSGMSLSAIKAYESGSRHPSLAALDALIDALGLPREEANPIRAGAGYAIDWQSLFKDRFVFDQTNLRDEIDAYPWPVFVTNMAFDVVSANTSFERLWRVDVNALGVEPAERNFLARATEADLAARVANYDEVLTFMMGLAKGDPRFAQDPERPSPWLRDAFSTLLGGDPAYITRLLGLWEAAPALPHRMRHQYRVVWKLNRREVITFLAETSVADIWNELSWNQWVPGDGESWRLMEDVMSDRASTGQNSRIGMRSARAPASKRLS